MFMDDDNKARNTIKTDIQKNLFVEAGAGSGKTTMLTDRMVQMVESGIPVNEICAITFTRAAANEFYSRFQEKLSRSKNPRAAEALNNIDLCFMGTIDSFCNRILSEHPVEAKIPTSSVILPEDELIAEYRHEFSKISSGEYKDLTAKYQRVVELNFNKTEDIFAKAVSTLMDMRNAQFQYVPPKKGTIDSIFSADIDRIRKLLSFLDSHRELNTGSEKGNIKAWESLSDCIREVNKPWEENSFNIVKNLSALKGIRIVPDGKTILDKCVPECSDYFIAQTSGTKNITIKHYYIDDEADPFLISKLENYRYSVMMDLVASSIDVISESLRTQGKLSFFDFLLYFRDLLKEDISSGGKLVKHITDRYKYFLIDEFQDTNPLQAEIFFYLAAEAPKADWRECKPRPGSLFVVGDPKQSIYRFRNADIGSYKSVKELFTGDVGEDLYLTRNYRSVKPMKDWFNDTFTGLMQESSVQSGFKPIPIDAEDTDDPQCVLEGAFKYTPMDRSDAENVCEIIKSIVDNDAIKLRKKVRKDDGTEEWQYFPVKYGDIMVLTFTKGGISRHMKELRENGVPFHAAGEVLFKDCPALVAVSYLFERVADRGDKKAVFKADRLSSVKLKEDVLDKAYGMSSSALFALLLDECQVLKKTGIENIEYLYYAQELLRAREIDGSVDSLKAGSEFLKSLLSSGKDITERTLQLSGDLDSVYIANVHKVKGMEAPIVILSNPSSTNREPVFRKTDDKSYLFRVQEKGKNGYYDLISTNEYKAEEDTEKNVLEFEKDRLRYVAATRAMNALIISSKPKKPDRFGNIEEYATNPWGSLASRTDKNIFESVIWKYKKDAKNCGRKIVDAEQVDALYREAEESSSLNNENRSGREKPSYELKKPSDVKIKDKSAKANAEIDEPEASELPAAELSEAKVKSEKSRPGNAALVGTMVHRLMECIVSSGLADKGHADAVIEQIIKDHRDDLVSAESYYRDTLKGVFDTLSLGGYDQSATGAPKDILAKLIKEAEEVHCELPFCYMEKGSPNIWNGVMDVVYKENGKWHILDYKTDAEIEQTKAGHEDQLNSYIAAFKELTGEDADAMIYSIPV